VVLIPGHDGKNLILDGKESIHDFGIELSSTTFPDKGEGLFHRECRLVEPLGRQCVEDIRNGGYAAHQGYPRAFELFGIVGSVPSFVMGEGNDPRRFQESDAGALEDSVSKDGKLLHDFPFIGIELAGLQEYPVRYADFAHIMHWSRIKDGLHGFFSSAPTCKAMAAE